MNTAANNFNMFDKAMDLVIAVLGEELKDVYNILIQNNVCKVFFPLHVPLNALCGREDITVNFENSASVVLVH